MKYGKEYYTTSNYYTYLDRQDRYDKIAYETLDLLHKLNVHPKVALDYGCAVGFLVKSLMEAGVDAYGYDISKWATQEAISRCGSFSIYTDPPDLDFELIYVLDVLEHMELYEVYDFLRDTTADHIIFRVPLAKKWGSEYYLRVSEQDPTHIIRATKDQWKDIFYNSGFVVQELNLNTIYTSEGVLSGLAIGSKI
jgi:hypothetical protein